MLFSLNVLLVTTLAVLLVIEFVLVLFLFPFPFVCHQILIHFLSLIPAVLTLLEWENTFPYCNVQAQFIFYFLSFHFSSEHQPCLSI